MATVKQDFTAKLQTTKNGDIEEVSFAAGENVQITQTWEHHYLLKNKDGHFFTIAKELIEP